MTDPGLDDVARHEIVRLSKSLFERGYSAGSSGNISVAVADGILIKIKFRRWETRQ